VVDAAVVLATSVFSSTVPFDAGAASACIFIFSLVVRPSEPPPDSWRFHFLQKLVSIDSRVVDRLVSPHQPGQEHARRNSKRKCPQTRLPTWRTNRIQGTQNE
jgi:hypothetical protein